MKLRFDIEQNTEAWYEIKLGKFSASPAADLLMDKKNKGYINLIDRIVEERITNKPTESKKFNGNFYTDRGHEFEPQARLDYEIRNLQVVKTIGVIELDNWTLCSPDGLINEKGLYQAKCPIFNTQKEYLNKYEELIKKELTPNEILYKISSQYYKQMQFELYVSGREYNVFNSYHPNLPPLDIKINRDQDMIKTIAERLEEAKTEATKEIQKLNNLKIAG